MSSSRPGGHLAVVRGAVGLVLLAPVLHFSLLHLWHYRSADGLPAALALAVLAGAADTAAAAAAEPLRAALYAVVVAVLWRLAFGRRGRR